MYLQVLWVLLPLALADGDVERHVQAEDKHVLALVAPRRVGAHLAARAAGDDNGK